MQTISFWRSMKQASALWPQRRFVKINGKSHEYTEATPRPSPTSRWDDYELVAWAHEGNYQTRAIREPGGRVWP